MLGIIGLNNKTASLDIREKFTISKEEILPFSELLQDEIGITDIVVLSTCNRTEIYFTQSRHNFDVAAKDVFNTLSCFKVVTENYWDNFYCYSEDEAVKHLFNVASGIDSMVIGEDQIIGQIKEAYLFCTKAALTDAILMRLFQKSFETGKRVRTETKIKYGISSISGAAVHFCSDLLKKKHNARILMIGAGESGKLVLQNFNKQGIENITVTNRTEEKAIKLAEQFQCNVLPFNQLNQHLYLYDVIIVATGATDALISKQMLETSVDKRKEALQIFIDISVPRNIEKFEHSLIKIYTIDALEAVVNKNLDKRMGHVEAANKIINEVVAEFMDWKASRSLRPAIKNITRNIEHVASMEVKNYQKVTSEEELKIVSEYSEHLAKKMTRVLIKNLKDITDNGKDTESLQVLEKLFTYTD